MGLPAISGLIGGILAVVAGIMVLIWPRIIAWVVGIYLIIFGAFAVLRAPYMMYAIVIALRAMNFPLVFFVGGYVAHSPLPAFPSALVALAGPLTNFIVWYLTRLAVRFNVLKKYHRILVPMGKLNLFLGIFNMLPIPGFDGFHFFQGLFSAFM